MGIQLSDDDIKRREIKIRNIKKNVEKLKEAVKNWKTWD
jgi:hypothetical protein